MKLAFRAICAIAAVGAIMAVFRRGGTSPGVRLGRMPDIPGRVGEARCHRSHRLRLPVRPEPMVDLRRLREGSRFNRVGYLMMGTLVALLFGLVGLGMWASTLDGAARDRRLYGRAWNQF